MNTIEPDVTAAVKSSTSVFVTTKMIAVGTSKMGEAKSLFTKIPANETYCKNTLMKLAASSS